MQDTPPPVSVALIQWLFVTFTSLVNWLINFLEQLTIWLIDDFGVFAQPQFVIFLSANCIQIDTVVLRSGGLLWAALWGQINTHDLPLLQKEK